MTLSQLVLGLLPIEQLLLSALGDLIDPIPPVLLILAQRSVNVLGDPLRPHEERQFLLLHHVE